jgi:hypothetical protein
MHYTLKKYGGVEEQLNTSLTLALDGGEWPDSCSRRFTPGERATGTHWIGGWVGSRAGLDLVQKKRKKSLAPARNLIPIPHFPKPVA